MPSSLRAGASRGWSSWRAVVGPRPVVGLPARLRLDYRRSDEIAPGQPLMSRDNLDSMRATNVASGPRVWMAGITPRTVTTSPDVSVPAQIRFPRPWTGHHRVMVHITILSGPISV
jgi:hypothetical protein